MFYPSYAHVLLMKFSQVAPHTLLHDAQNVPFFLFNIFFTSSSSLFI
jgi:hypothetical protein